MVVQFDDSSTAAEIDILKFQLAVVRKIDSSDSDSSGSDLDAPFLEWPRYGHGPENDSSQLDTYDIGEGLTLSRQLYKSTNVVSSFSSSVIDNPRDARPGVKVRMWDPAECFNHLSYDPYAATVVSLLALIYIPFSARLFTVNVLVLLIATSPLSTVRILRSGQQRQSSCYM